MADVLHAGLDLLDRQIVDSDDVLVGKVDDVELEGGRGEPLRAVALLTGAHAYGGRLGGRIGRWIVSIASRLGGTDQPIRIPFESVEEVDVLIKLSVPAREIDRLERVDHWLRDHLIGRIPGAHDASE